MIKEEIVIDIVDNGLDQAIRKTNALSAATKTASKETDNMSDSMKDSSIAVLDNGGAMGLLNDATGGLAMTVKDAVEATALFTQSSKLSAFFQKLSSKAALENAAATNVASGSTAALTLSQSIYAAVVGTSTGAMKLFRIALVSTGIGALVVGIGLLIANFDKVKKAVMNFIPGLAIVGEIFEKLVDTVTDFVGITSDATREIDKMVESANASLKRSEHFLEANGDKYDEYTQRKMKANIDYNKKVKELADDEELTDREKLSRMKDFRDKANREIVKADKDRQAEIDKNRKIAEEKAETERKARADKAKAEAEKEAQRQKEIAEAKRKLAEDNLKAENEFQVKINEAQFEQRMLDIENVQAQSDAIAKIEEEKTNLDIKQAEDQKIRDEAVYNNRIAIATQTVNLIAQLAGEGSAIAKGVAVAQATIDTYKGAVSAYSAMAGIPIVGPALGAVAAGAVVVSGIANVKKILATKPVEKNAPSAGAGASAPPAPSFNLVQGTGANQIAESVGGQNRPVQAFVVSSNVTSAQAMDRNIVNESKL